MLFDALIITTLFALFGISHSVLASHKVKLNIAQKLNDKIAFYRLFYNLFSFISLSFIYIVSPKPDYIVYDLLFPYDITIVVLQIFSGIALIWTTKFINMKEFLGISQIQRFFQKQYNDKDLDEKLELRIEGPFKYSRHPIYLFSSLVLLLRPTMDFFYIIFLVNILLYFYIGSIYEEKKLVAIFGSEYSDYQNTVPKIF